MNCKLTVRGKQGHIAYPQKSINAAHFMVKALDALIGLKLDDGNEFFDPSHLAISTVDIGNPTANISPESAEARFNIRFNNLHNALRDLQSLLIKTIRAIIPNQQNDIHDNTDTDSARFSLEILSASEAFFCPPTATSCKNCKRDKAGYGR